MAADSRLLAIAASVDVFCLGDEHPNDIDFGNFEPSSRKELLQWSAGPSGVAGCTCLRDPQALRPDASLSLLDRSMLTLCLLDSLSQAGWAGQSRLVEHAPDSPKVFDDLKPMTKKDYLRCVIELDDLFPARVLNEFSWESCAPYIL